MDPYEFLRISRSADGSLDRSALPFLPVASNASDPSLPVISKDLPLNPSRHTWLRLYRPTCPHPHPLPLLIYFHGGGFIVFSAATSLFHSSCLRLAAALPALILSVDHRLAPENRLPAAYDDAIDALLWIRTHARDPTAADPWLAAGVDFTRCFLIGSSSGGNVALHAGLRAIELDLKPIEIAGIVLNQPFFGGVERTRSEIEMESDKILPLPANDLMWDLALPEGADRDHEFCNLATAAAEAMGRLPRCLVRGYLGDPLIDRQRELVKMMERKEVKVVAKLEYEGYHAIEIFREEMAEKLVEDVKEFVGRRDEASPA